MKDVLAAHHQEIKQTLKYRIGQLATTINDNQGATEAKIERATNDINMRFD